MLVGDTIDELNETFSVKLKPSPLNATLADDTGAGTIIDDDGPNISIGDATISEGAAGGTTTAVFQVVLSQASPQEVSFAYSTANDTAKAGEDYVEIGAGQRLTMAPGQLIAQISVTVNGDEPRRGRRGEVPAEPRRGHRRRSHRNRHRQAGHRHDQGRRRRPEARREQRARTRRHRRSEHGEDPAHADGGQRAAARGALRRDRRDGDEQRRLRRRDDRRGLQRGRDGQGDQHPARPRRGGRGRRDVPPGNRGSRWRRGDPDGDRHDRRRRRHRSEHASHGGR